MGFQPTFPVAEFSSHRLTGGGSGRKQFQIRNGLEFVNLGTREVQVLQGSGGDRLLCLDARRRIGIPVIGAAALRGDLMEESLRGGHVHQANNLSAAAGLPEDHYVAGISAKRFDVVVNPLQRCYQVSHSGLAGIRIVGAICGKIERSYDVKPVIHADRHHIAKLAESPAVIRISFHRRSVREAPTVHPHHYGFLHRRVQVLGPNIEVLAVFVWNPEPMREDEFVGADVA